MSGAIEPTSDAEILVEVEAVASRRRPVFPDWLERRFEKETGQRYGTILSQDLTRTALYYNIMIVGDILLAPDVAPLALVLHLLVVTPLMLAAAALCRLPLPPLTRDLAAASAPFLIACQILWIFAVSASPTASHYLFFVSMNVATVNTAMRLRHRAASWATYACFLTLPVVLAATQKMPAPVAVMQCFSLVVCGLVTLRGMADREREFRRAYLSGLRDRLKIAASYAEAKLDALTGAYNRRGLEAAVSAVWSGEDAEAAVILFDVDRFKAYNDFYGHPAGDACLRRIAVAARDALGERAATLARYGGEEFLALLSGSAAEQAAAIAEDLRRAVMALNIVHAGAVERRMVSASFGVARGRTGEIGFEALTSAADSALYLAKSAGRNKVACALAA